MGNLISALTDLFTNFAGGQEHRVVLIGLDAAGKTTLLYNMKFRECIHTVPTVGFNFEEVKIANLTMNIWDVGGQSIIRPLWRYYYEGATAVIFVVDSADHERMQEAAEILTNVLSDDHLKKAALLVMANKQDLPNAASVSDLCSTLGVGSMYSRRWHIQACCATSGDGVYEGFEWLSNTLKSMPAHSK